MNKIGNILGYILILGLLLIVSIVNIENIVYFNLSNIYVVLFLIYFIFSILFTIYGKIKKEKSSNDFQYIIQFILFFCILIIPGIIINHNFLLENIGENNLYLRVYGKVAMGYFAMALIISPILEFIKNDIGRKHLILARKILGILSFIFFLKHSLEYFALDYIFQTQYHPDIPYLTYVLKHLLVRYDALIGTLIGIFMLILGFTSNKFSMKFLGSKWKKVQRLVFPVFLFSIIHIAFTSRFNEYYIFLISLVVIIRLVAYLNRKQRRNSGKIVGYRCIPCGYIYDEKIGDIDSGILPGTKFIDISDNWYCPVCGVTKDDFEPIYEGEDTSLDSEIVGYKMLTGDVLELQIQIKNKKNISVQPGQFANINYGNFCRSYSVVSVDKNILTFAIKLKFGGAGSEILKRKKIGDSLLFNGVFGKCILKNTNNPKVFIATGTGLSPIINMLHNTYTPDITLFFGVANQKDLFYLDKIKDIIQLDSKIFLSRENIVKYKHGRIDISIYNFTSNTEFYICGNPGLVKSTREYLEKSGFKYVYSEEF